MRRSSTIRSTSPVAGFTCTASAPTSSSPRPSSVSSARVHLSSSVSFGFTGADPEAEAWNAFVADVRRRLERDYVLLSETDSGFQVWRIDSAAER